MTENRFLVDSSAWIEYFRATAVGAKVKSIVENSENTILTPNIVTAEVISKILREGEETEKIISAIKTLSVPAEENQSYYFEVGKEHFLMKKNFKNISLADAIIKVLGEKNNARIITKDIHLKGKNTFFIG